MVEKVNDNSLRERLMPILKREAIDIKDLTRSLLSQRVLSCEISSNVPEKFPFSTRSQANSFIHAELTRPFGFHLFVLDPDGILSNQRLRSRYQYACRY